MPFQYICPCCHKRVKCLWNTHRCTRDKHGIHCDKSIRKAQRALKAARIMFQNAKQKEQRAKQKEQRAKQKEQRAKQKEQRAKQKEQRATKNNNSSTQSAPAAADVVNDITSDERSESDYSDYCDAYLAKQRKINRMNANDGGMPEVQDIGNTCLEERNSIPVHTSEEQQQINLSNTEESMHAYGPLKGDDMIRDTAQSMSYGIRCALPYPGIADIAHCQTCFVPISRYSSICQNCEDKEDEAKYLSSLYAPQLIVPCPNGPELLVKQLKKQEHQQHTKNLKPAKQQKQKQKQQQQPTPAPVKPNKQPKAAPKPSPIPKPPQPKPKKAATVPSTPKAAKPPKQPKPTKLSKKQPTQQTHQSKVEQSKVEVQLPTTQVAEVSVSSLYTEEPFLLSDLSIEIRKSKAARSTV